MQNTKNNLDYLVRLDLLSTPCIYATDTAFKHSMLEIDTELPPGYAKFKINTQTQELWSEFINSRGYLRRYIKFWLYLD